jgi:hypothetical protein
MLLDEPLDVFSTEADQWALAFAACPEQDNWQSRLVAADMVIDPVNRYPQIDGHLLRRPQRFNDWAYNAHGKSNS